MLGQSLNGLSNASTGTVSTVEITNGRAVLDNAGLMFDGQFSRAGNDLQISGASGDVIFVTDYFNQSEPATLVSPHGAVLTGDVVLALAGPRAQGQFAQATGSGTSSLTQIGVVETLTGSATATRTDGTVVKLKIGDAVFKGDTVQTASGSALGITFKDGTVFNMSATARMVLNNLVYEDGGSENAMLFSLVQGGFSFVAGKVAPTGDMKINTPVATMGIRGTTPFVLIADNGKTTFSILPDPTTEKVGVYSLFHRETGQLIGTVSDTGSKFEFASVSSAPVEITKTATDLLADSQVQKNLTDTFSKAQQNPFNEGVTTGTDGGEQKKENKEGDDKQQPEDGEQGAAVPGSGVTTEVVEAKFEGEATDDLGEGAGTNLNVEAGAETGGDAEDTPLETTSTEPEAPIEIVVEEPPVIDPPTNTPPSIALPPTPTVLEDGSITVTGFSIADDGDNVAVNISAQSTVTLATVTGLTFSVGDGVNDEVMSFTGSPADVTAALNGLTYNPTPDNDVGGGVTITVSDGIDLATAVLTVDISAVNDVPVVSVTNPAVVSEDSGIPTVAVDVLNQTSIIDPDTLDVQSYVAGSAVASVGAGSAAGVVLGQVGVNTATGVVTYNPNDFSFLTAGESAFFDVDFQVQSGPDTSSQSLTIEITGVNDVPVITVVDPAPVAEGDVGVGTPAITVDVFTQTSITDPDTADAQSYVAGSAVASVGAGSPAGVILGQVSVNATTGIVTYNPDDFDFLAAGESAFFDVDFQVQSGPDTSNQSLTIEITGVNDAPVITVVDPTSVFEGDTGAGTSAITVDVFAQTSITDPDASDAQSYVAGSAVASIGAGSPAGVILGQVAVNATTGVVTYNPDDFDFLAAGESAFFDVDFQVQSGPDTSSQSLTIEITGVNDAPVITVADPASVVEGDNGAGTSAVTVDVFAQTSITDPDASDAQSYVAGSAVASVGAGSPAGVILGQVAVNVTTGVVTYNPDDFDFLAAGESAFFDVDFQVQSGPDTSSQSLTIEITGVNDAPVVTVVDPASVFEGDTGAGTLAITVDVFAQTSITDPDASDVQSYVAGSAVASVGAGSPAGVILGQVAVNATTGVVTYNPDDFDFLAAGESAFFDVDFQVQSGPDTSNQSLTIEITGVNDAPSGADNTITIDEDVDHVFSVADFGFSDPIDVSANALQSVFIGAAPGVGGDGQLLLNGVQIFGGTNVTVADINAGNLVFRPDADKNGNNFADISFQVIDDGGTVNGGVNTDPTSKTITFDVTAVNDAPVAVADTARATAVTVPSVMDDIDAIIVNDNHGSALGTNATQVLTNDGSGGLVAAPAVGAPSARNNDVKLADFDGDGDLDAITSSFQLLENLGGSFSSSNIAGTTGSAQGIAVGDIDGDGDIDIIAANWPYTANQILVNQGGAQGGTEGTFVVSTAAGGNNHSRDVALVDVDGDGDLDAIIANDTSDNQILINQGGIQGGTEGTVISFTLSSLENQAAVISSDVVFADVDGDGDQDALIANATGNNELLTNDGNGNFTAGLLPGGSFSSTAIGVGDFDGDGDIDIIVTNNSGEANQVLINQGGDQAGTEGTFVTSTISGSAGSSTDVAIVDIDGDGDLDAFITNNNFSTSAQGNQLLLNDGSGNFTVSSLAGGANASKAIAFGDLDGDGVVAAVDANGLPNIHLSPVTGTVAANDSDIDAGAVLTFTLDAPVAGLTMAADGSFVFDPSNPTYASLAEGATTDIVANYTVTDENSATDQSTLTITVTGTNDAPVVSATTNPADVTEGDTGILSNESFVLSSFFTGSDADTGETPIVNAASVNITVNPSSDTSNFSSLATNGTGATTRIDVDTANFDFLGSGEKAVFDVSFDVVSGSDTVNRTITITITGTNDAPILDLDLNDSSGATGGDYNDTFTEGGPAVHIGDLGESDLDITDIDDTNFESVIVTLTNRPDGGDESLSFTGTLPGGVTLTAYNPATGVIVLTGTATKGQYEGLIEGIVYNNSSTSPDTADRIIEVVVNDGNDNSNVATATITVVAVNDVPVTTDFTLIVDEDVSHTFSSGEFPFTDADAGDALASVRIISLPTNGELRLSGVVVTVGQVIAIAAIANLIYTPPADANGVAADSFQFQVSDGTATSLTQTVTFDINAINDDPTAVTDVFEGVAGGQITGNLLTNDLNPDGGALTIKTATIFTEQGNFVEVQSDGSVTFRTIGNFTGFDSFVYSIADAQGDIDSGYATFTINPSDNSDSVVSGTSGNDVLIGTSGADSLTGLAGDDLIFGGGTSLDLANVFSDVDVLDGGDGNDRIYGTESHFEVIGGAGDDFLFAAESLLDTGIGFSVVDYSSSTSGIQANFSLITRTIDSKTLDPNNVSDGLGGTDWVKGYTNLVDSGFDDTIVVDGGVAGANIKTVLLSGGDDDVTFINPVAGESGISYRFAGSDDGISGVHALLSNGTASGLTAGNVLAPNPFYPPLVAPVTNTAIGNDTFSTNISNLTGSQFADQLIGNNLDNVFEGLGGNDYIGGNSGTDKVSYLFSPIGVDVDLSANLAKEDGFGTNDFLVSIEDVEGSLHDDVIIGDGSANTLVGLFGNDTISGGAGNDVIIGGTKDDQAYDGDDILDGGDGDDTISGGSGDDHLIGGIGNDTLDGGNGYDLLEGGDGADTLISGGTPQDLLSNAGITFDGHDILNGGDGDDTLISTGGATILTGGAGADTLSDISTGTNFDWAQVNYRTSTGSVKANLSDTARVVGGSPVLAAFTVQDGLGSLDNVQGFHVFRDSDNDDTIFVDDTYANSFSSPGFPFIEIRLSAGDDDVTFSNFTNGTARISYELADSANGTDGVHLDLGAGTAHGLTTADIIAGNTLFTPTELVNTSIGNDTFTGANYARGSKFNDQLIGGAANERFRGSTGNDYIDGGGGSDFAEYSNSTSGVVVDLGLGVASDDGLGGNDILVNIENVRGSDFDDSITGDGNANQIRGRRGDDVLTGLGGNDQLRGDDGNDQLFGGDGDDELRGGGSPDVIGAAGDILIGGAGNDILRAGNGFSILRGDGGNDTLRVEISTNTFSDFAIGDYKNAVGSVNANLTGTAVTVGGTFLQPYTVEDGEGGIDTIVNGQGVHVFRDGAGNDEILVDGTYTNSYGNWIEVRLSGGNDVVTFSGVANARISYRSSTSADGTTGVNINLATGMAAGLILADIAPGNTLFSTGLTVNNSVGTDTFSGATRARGSQFNDQIIGSSADERFRGEGGNDYIDGGGGIDTLTHFSETNGIVVNLSTGTVSDDGLGGNDQVVNIENVRGTVHNDDITGDSGVNDLRGNAGDDVLTGLGGNDRLIGDANNPEFDGGAGGNDQLFGGDGDDRLEGGAGDDQLFGGDQQDFLIGGPGDDFIDGGDDFFAGGFGIRGASDQVSYADSPDGVVVDLEHGYAEDGYGTIDVLKDIEVVRGSQFDDVLRGGNPENDWYEDFRPGDGADTVDGGSGFDRVRYNDSPTGVTVNLSNSTDVSSGVLAGQASDGFGNTDILTNLESVVGSSFEDRLIANDVGVQFRALKGNDVLIGGAGIDEADYAFTGGIQGISVNLNNATNQVTDTFGTFDTLTDVENIRGSDFNDTIIGDNNDNKISGLAGNDIIDGFGGHDIVDYQRDFNAALDSGFIPTSGVTVNLQSGIATDVVGGTDTLSGIEEVWGTTLNDVLVGDLLDNVLASGSGADTLTGGLGADEFVTMEGDVGVDVITDFTVGDGDVLNLEDLLDAAYTTGTASDYVRAVEIGSSGDTTVSVDADGTANGVNFVDIATLQGVSTGTTLSYIYDDAEAATTITVT